MVRYYLGVSLQLRGVLLWSCGSPLLYAKRITVLKVASLGVLSGGSHYVDFVRATLSDSDRCVFSYCCASACFG